MSGINKVIIVGNLGRDPEIRYTQGGTAVTQLSVATTRSFTRGEERVEETEWHRVVVWGKTAEHCGQYLTKGRQVYVEGRLQTRSWDDKDGNKRYATEIVAETVQFLGGKPADARPAQPGKPASKAEDNGWEQYPGRGADDDIPF